MKRKHLALLPLVIGTVFGAAAQAETITFQGQVIKSTCIPNVGGAGQDGTVQLPLISTNLLPNVGSTAGTTSFDIDLTGCDPTPHTVKAYFWQSNAVNNRLSRTTGSGNGWQYELRDKDNNNQILVGNTSTVVVANNANDPGADVDSGGNATLTYNVQYYRSGTVSPGTVNAVANYVIYAN